MSRRPISIAGQPPLARYSPALRAGSLVFISGQVATGDDGAVITGGIEAQTRLVFAHMQRLLAADGLDLNDVCHVHTYLTRSDDFAGFDDTFGQVFQPPYPARITVRGELLVAGALIESTAIAIAGEQG
jgi:2-iminobutanoate/2-iminopropanoate deaminase